MPSCGYLLQPLEYTSLMTIVPAFEYISGRIRLTSCPETRTLSDAPLKTDVPLRSLSEIRKGQGRDTLPVGFSPADITVADVFSGDLDSRPDE